MSRSFVDLLTSEEEALIRLGGSGYLVVAQSKPNILRLWLAVQHPTEESFRVVRYLGRTRNKGKRVSALKEIQDLGLRFTILSAKWCGSIVHKLDWTAIINEDQKPR